MKYRKKPVVIEAVQWNGLNLQEVKDFVGDSLVYDIYDAAWEAGVAAPVVDMKIKTLEGDMQVSKGDYIIKGVQGEFYPCKPDIFKKTYEKETLEDQDEECGYWIEEYLGYGAYRYKCSKCGAYFGEDVIREFEHNKYCADCGKKMKLR